MINADYRSLPPQILHVQDISAESSLNAYMYVMDYDRLKNKKHALCNTL